VLAWAQTQIFEVYYYRMYAALVVIAAAHALVLLPVSFQLQVLPRDRSAGYVAGHISQCTWSLQVLLALVGPPPLAVRRPSDDNLSLQVRQQGQGFRADYY
jgi:hypothetical protein